MFYFHAHESGRDGITWMLHISVFLWSSLCKIGFGDFVPGTGLAKSSSIGHPQAGSIDGIVGMRADTGAGHTKLVIKFVYLLLGMGLIAMCYNLMREEVIVKARELKAKLRMLGTPLPLPSPLTSPSGDVEGQREEASPSGEEQHTSRPLTIRSTPIRLRGVSGYDGRSNDVVYCPPATHTLRNSAVVFFGGDLQDFPENMESHRDNKHYLRWNLESTAILLHSCFPESHIVVVRPSRSTTPKLATFMEIVSSDMEQNRMEFKTFSCYDNFVPCNNCGSPDHTPTHYALHHLERLLQGISSRIRSAPESELLVAEVTSLGGTSAGENDSAERQPEEAGVVHRHEPSDNGGMRQRRARARDRVRTGNDLESREEGVEEEEDIPEDEIAEESPLMTDAGVAPAQCLTMENGAASDDVVGVGGSVESGRLWWRENINLDKAELTLVGFSKGCVVLNQFIYEFHYLKTLTPDDNTMMRLVTRIRDMFWLDGGHAGGKNTWITSRSLLETLTRLGIGIHIHVTPYQVQDERRPWIRKEEKTFGELLRRLGAPVSRTLHFESQPPTLYTHFDVLAVFRPPQSRMQ